MSQSEPTDDKLDELHVEVLEAGILTVKHHRDLLTVLLPEQEY